MTVKERVEIVYLIAGTISAAGTLIAAVFAAFVYQRNSTFERAKWASSLYEKFYEGVGLKQIRDKLDCLNDSDSVNEIVIREEPAFTDYLNSFEFIAFLRTSKQLKDSEIDVLFGYYLDCLNRHDMKSSIRWTRRKAFSSGRKQRFGWIMEAAAKDGFTSTIDIQVKQNASAVATIFVLKSRQQRVTIVK